MKRRFHRIMRAVTVLFLWLLVKLNGIVLKDIENVFLTCTVYVINIFCYIFALGITCPDLENPANGAVTVNGMNPGDTATYTCNSGYELEGAETLTCGSDGMWSPDPPVCTRELSHK